MRPLRARLSWGLVAAVATCGLLGVEAWPLTGWRLFSARRHAISSRFEARMVGADGSEALLPFGLLPHSYSGFVPVLAEMAGQSPADREPACGAWAEATSRATGAHVAEVRVYEVADDLRDGTNRAALAWTCGRRVP